MVRLLQVRASAGNVAEAKAVSQPGKAMKVMADLFGELGKVVADASK